MEHRDFFCVTSFVFGDHGGTLLGARVREVLSRVNTHVEDDSD